MSAPSETATVPSTREFSIVWATYALHALGIFCIVFGPLLGLIVNYAKRGDDASGLVASHHRWLIRTFWWTLAGYLASFALILGSVAPLARDVLRTAVQRDGHVGVDTLVQIDWTSLLAMAGLATIGAVGLLLVWLWFIYRLVRGGLRLADAQPAP